MGPILYKYIPPVILITGSMISIWFLMANLQPLQPALYVFVVCVVLGFYLNVEVFGNGLIIAAKRYMLNMTKRKYFVHMALLAITALGLIARLFFYFRFSYSPISDPVTFYDAAKNIAAGHTLQGDGYIAAFPYLAAYDNMLGVTMKLIPSPWVATILLNTTFDVLSSAVLFILLKMLLKPTSKLPTVAFGMWMLNPLNIVFSVISIPVVVVNFFIVFTLLISYALVRQVTRLRNKYSLLLSIALGLVIGIGNCFRPIFLVMIIALIIVYEITFLTTKKSLESLKLFATCMLLTLLIFAGIQRLNISFVSYEIGLHAASNPSGVSLYVGSSWETSGEWRPYINGEMNRICEKSNAQKNYDECHAELRSAAIARYKSYGILNAASLFIRKLYHQAGQQNYFYNANQSIVGYTESKTFKFINIYAAIYLMILFILSAKFLYGLARQPAPNQIDHMVLLFIALVMIGWFFSFMVVESAPRYSTILYPMFIIFSVLMLDNKHRDRHAVR